MEKRKQDHIDISLNKKIDLNSAGFDRLRFIHQALPEVDFDDITLNSTFFKKKIGAPIIISGMTGGSKFKDINKNLAISAEKLNIPMCVGSQRILLEDPSHIDDFNIRKYCPSVPLIGNIGAVQFNYGVGLKDCRNLVKMIGADGLSIHLNPLQEAIQLEGQKNFKGLLKKIKTIVAKIGCPVIIKEVGFGISSDTSKKLQNIGIKYIDISGHGGTNWALIEGMRGNYHRGNTFKDWGIPTVDAIQMNKNVDIKLIAGGGIRTGLDAAKALALGADYVSLALPLLSPAALSPDRVIEFLEEFIYEMKIAFFCTGCRSISEFKKKAKIVKSF